MSSPDSAAVAPLPPVVKMPVMPLLLSIAVSGLLAAGGCTGAIYWLTRSGKLNASGAALPAGVAGASAGAAPAPLAQPTKNLALEPLLANLADPDGHAYLRLGLTLQTFQEKAAAKEEKEVKGPAPEEAGLRDTVLDVLGHEQSTDLLAADGKEQLKKKLMQALALRQPAVHVHELYFTDFLVQR